MVGLGEVLNAVKSVFVSKTAFSGPLFGLLCLPLAVELYSKLPVRCSNTVWPLLPQPPTLPEDVLNSKSIAVLFPGYGGVDANTDRIVEEINKEGATTAYCYDWEMFRGNLFRSASCCIDIGTQLGKELASSKNIESVHFIGISVGSFAANACLDSFSTEIEKQKKSGARKKFTPMLQPPTAEGAGKGGDPESPLTRATFLDPFTSKGVFGAGFGTKKFGAAAQYAEQYLNTDDPVPSTNEPCSQCHCFDITECGDRDSFVPLPNDNMHSWPAAFYGLNYRQNRNLGTRLSAGHRAFPRGKISRVG